MRTLGTAITLFKTAGGLFGILLSAAFICPAAVCEPIAQITITTDKYPAQNTPISISADSLNIKDAENFEGFVRQVRPAPAGSSRIIPVQTDKCTNEVCFIIPQIASNSSAVFYLYAGSDDANKTNGADYEGLCLAQNEKRLIISAVGKNRKQNLVTYNFGVIMPPKPISAVYGRSGYIHPLCTAEGKILTCVHPPDHLHHLGLWNPWTNVTYDGKHIDFWNLGKKQGTVRFVRFKSVQCGKVFAGFEAVKRSVAFNISSEKETAVLNEISSVKLWNTLKDNGRGYLIDYITTFTPAGDKPVVLNQYRYGGFGFRATGQWKGKNRHYLTSEGKTIADADGSRARWCIVSGNTDSGPAGVVFMSFPENHQFPEPIRIWGKKFNDVFFNFCPIKKQPWTVKPNEKYTLKYRLYVYDGIITQESAETIWQNFAHLPKIEIERIRR